MPKLPGLKRLREERAYTQMELAGISGVSRPAIANLELGITAARASTHRKLALALGVEPQDLVREADPPKGIGPWDLDWALSHGSRDAFRSALKAVPQEYRMPLAVALREQIGMLNGDYAAAPKDGPERETIGKEITRLEALYGAALIATMDDDLTRQWFERVARRNEQMIQRRNRQHDDQSRLFDNGDKAAG